MAAPIKNRLGIDKAQTIAMALDGNVACDMIASMTGIEVGTVEKLKAYVDNLKKKDNDKACAMRASNSFSEDVYIAMETRYKFIPVKKDPEKETNDFRGDLINRVGQLCDLTETQTNKLEDMKQVCIALNQTIRLLINGQMQQNGNVKAQVSGLTQSGGIRR